LADRGKCRTGVVGLDHDSDRPVEGGIQFLLILLKETVVPMS